MRVHMKDTLKTMPSTRHQEGRRTDRQTHTVSKPHAVPQMSRTPSSYTEPSNYTCTARQTDTQTQKYTHRHTASTHPQNHTLKYTQDIPRQQAGRQSDTFQHGQTEPLTYTPRHTYTRPSGAHADERARTRGPSAGPSLPLDSAQGAGQRRSQRARPGHPAGLRPRGHSPG